MSDYFALDTASDETVRASADALALPSVLIQMRPRSIASRNSRGTCRDRAPTCDRPAVVDIDRNPGGSSKGLQDDHPHQPFPVKSGAGRAAKSCYFVVVINGLALGVTATRE